MRSSTHDYTKPGYYFITIRTQNSEYIFGKIIDNALKPNIYGEIIVEDWYWLEKQYSYILLGMWILMPNHLHGIIQIKHDSTKTYENDSNGRSRTATTSNTILATTENVTMDNKMLMNNDKIKPLGRIIGAFKTRSTKHINKIINTPGKKIWQRSYYDRIIRNKNEYFAIKQYIIDNPKKWRY